jgi:hypothetical protein
MTDYQNPHVEPDKDFKGIEFDLLNLSLERSALQVEQLEDRLSLIGTCNFPGCWMPEGHGGSHNCRGVCGGP